MMLFYRKSQLINWILGIYFLAILTSCLRNHESSISAKNLKQLKDKYNIATLNYFYETVFHEDFSVEKRNNILKWNSNPTIAIVGNQYGDEIRYVKRAITEINKLNLPIKCTLADTNDSASIRIFFGDLKKVCAFLKLDSVSISEIDTSSHFGQGNSISYNGVIDEAYIGIYYTDKDLTDSTRYKIVLEEIVQSLGIVGDSYSYPSSLFFENINPAKSLTPLDVDVLSLLYEPMIPANYTRQSFETNFSDELYGVNTPQKIKNLLEKYPQISHNDIEKCFTKGVLLKHPKETNIYLYGPIQKEDSLTIKRAILSFNEISPNIKIKLAQSTDIELPHGIVLVFRQLNHQKESIRVTNEAIAGKSCMFQKLIKNKIVLSFNTSENDKELRQRSIIDALYFSLVQMPREQSRTNELFKVKESYIVFTPRYANLLKLIYSNEFIDGFELSDFMKIKLSIFK